MTNILIVEDSDHLQFVLKLTLEFNNARPSLAALEVTRADKAITVFIMGDSKQVRGKRAYSVFDVSGAGCASAAAAAGALRQIITRQTVGRKGVRP